MKEEAKLFKFFPVSSVGLFYWTFANQRETGKNASDRDRNAKNNEERGANSSLLRSQLGDI